MSPSVRREYLPVICIALMLMMSAGAYRFLPDVMTVHWTFSFQPDGYAKKAIAVLVLPIIGAGLVCMQLIGRYVSGDGSTQLRFGTAVMLGVPILLIAHVMIIAVALSAVPHG